MKMSKKYDERPKTVEDVKRKEKSIIYVTRINYIVAVILIITAIVFMWLTSLKRTKTIESKYNSDQLKGLASKDISLAEKYSNIRRFIKNQIVFRY